MNSSSRFAVSVHALSVMAFMHKHGTPLVSSRMIATSVNTHPVVIRNLLRSLKAAGIIISKEGRDGGVRLSKPPGRILLSEIFAAVEGSSLLKAHANPEHKACPVSRAMKRVLPRIFREVDLAVQKTLRNKTLKQVIARV